MRNTFTMFTVSKHYRTGRNKAMHWFPIVVLDSLMSSLLKTLTLFQ